MNDRTIRVLEFTKMRDQLSSFATTKMGVEKCSGLMPHTQLAEVERAQQETEEALYVLKYRGDSPIGFSIDVRPYLDRASKGATLSQRMLLDIAQSLQSARQARAALVNDNEFTRLLSSLAGHLQPQRTLESDISGAIISEDEMSDNASSELASIRRHIRLSNQRVREKLNSLIHQPSYSKYLQEPIITVRNGRYVVPVRQEFRQNIPGLVHDQSSSGATLFIEPMALVELGNELKQWTAKEDQEIERILTALSAQAGDSADIIGGNVSLLAHLDFVFSKARLAQEMDAVRPRMNARGYIKLLKTRHPLIDRSTVVPADLWLGDEFSTLIITGPNTGGKTVTLKTVGLMTLMAQSGLQVPSSPGTELAVFGEVFADIGDEQSIEQSLSTFSSHMTNIVKILDEMEDNSLVLFDELGAGTDPTEGAALAQTILTHLQKRHIRTIATTHYSELKAYALSTKGVENASVEFDVATLRPTYRLSIGIPGKSNAFEISRKLGLPSGLIQSAQELLSKETIQFEDVIANAEYHRQVAQKERAMAKEMYEEAALMRRNMEKLQQEIEEKHRGADKKAKEEAKKIIDKAKRESTAILAELRLMHKSGDARSHEVNALSRRLNDASDVLSDALNFSPQTNRLSAGNISVGDSVSLADLGASATVLTLPDTKGELQIQAGIIKMKVHVSQLSKDETPDKKRPATSVHAQTGGKRASLECDVRGLSLDEALMEVDNYLDTAVMNGLESVSIIHGKGTGVLRAGIQKHLKSIPQVKSFRLGNYGEGESGVTMVTLK